MITIRTEDGKVMISLEGHQELRLREAIEQGTLPVRKMKAPSAISVHSKGFVITTDCTWEIAVGAKIYLWQDLLIFLS